MFGSKITGVLRHPGYNDIGSVVGSVLGFAGAKSQADAAEDAAEASAAATRYAADIQKEMFDKQVELQEPWRLAGVESVNRLQAGLAPGGEFDTRFSQTDWQQDPGYQFRLSEGLKALDRQAAARGGLISGSALKAAQRFGQQAASDEYQNAFNRYYTERTNALNPLQSMAGIGQTSANALGSAAQSYGTNVGNLTMANAANQGNAALVAGQARASMYGGLGTTLGNALAPGSRAGGYLNQSMSNMMGTTPAVGYGYGEPADWGWGG